MNGKEWQEKGLCRTKLKLKKKEKAKRKRKEESKPPFQRINEIIKELMRNWKSDGVSILRFPCLKCIHKRNVIESVPIPFQNVNQGRNPKQKVKISAKCEVEIYDAHE